MTKHKSVKTNILYCTRTNIRSKAHFDQLDLYCSSLHDNPFIVFAVRHTHCIRFRNFVGNKISFNKSLVPIWNDDDNVIKFLPYDAKHPICVERCLPRYVVTEQTRKWHADDDTSVGAAERQGGQSGALHRWSPVPPDAVAWWICYSLHE